MTNRVILLFVFMLGGLTHELSAKVSKSELPLADPCVFLEDDVYYAYGTHSDEGIECYTSTDLKHWSFRGLALHKDSTSGTHWFWAPEVIKRNGRYYMYYSANEHLYVAVASSPLGPFRQVAGPLLSERSIDGLPYLDDDGQWYFFFVRLHHGNHVWVARMTDDGMFLQTETLKPCVSAADDWEIDDEHFPQCRVAEGPSVWKHNGRYYLTYSANHYQSRKYGVGVAVASSVYGPWKKLPDNPILQQGFHLCGTGHHGLFYDKKGRLTMMFHAHNSATEVHPRLSYVVRMKIRPSDSGQERLSVGRRLIVPQLVK